MLRYKNRWTCPKCKRKFMNVNQWHSCGKYTVYEFLRKRSPRSISLYSKFTRELRKIGPFKTAPARTRIGFQTKMIFAAIYSMGKNFIRGHIVLDKEYRCNKFVKIEKFSAFCVVHHFKIFTEDFFDEDFRKFLRLSYIFSMKNKDID